MERIKLEISQKEKKKDFGWQSLFLGGTKNIFSDTEIYIFCCSFLNLLTCEKMNSPASFKKVAEEVKVALVYPIPT